jgi:CO/xanthine dehydrogenase Mo-binding subunit
LAINRRLANSHRLCSHALICQDQLLDRVIVPLLEGQVKDTNLDSYTPLRMGDEPELDIEFIDSAEAPTGLGEPGTTVVAPAIGNAIYAAVGARLRHLPIRPAAILEALHRR